MNDSYPKAAAWIAMYQDGGACRDSWINWGNTNLDRQPTKATAPWFADLDSIPFGLFKHLRCRLLDAFSVLPRA